MRVLEKTGGWRVGGIRFSILTWGRSGAVVRRNFRLSLEGHPGKEEDEGRSDTTFWLPTFQIQMNNFDRRRYQYYNVTNLRRTLKLNVDGFDEFHQQIHILERARVCVSRGGNIQLVWVNRLPHHLPKIPQYILLSTLKNTFIISCRIFQDLRYLPKKEILLRGKATHSWPRYIGGLQLDQALQLFRVSDVLQVDQQPLSWRVQVPLMFSPEESGNERERATGTRSCELQTFHLKHHDKPIGGNDPTATQDM